MHVVNRLLKLMAEKQIRENRVINAMAVSRETGLSRPTIASWMKDEITSFDKQTILILCQYFNCEVGDLLAIEHDENGK